VDRVACARNGINANQVLELVELAVGGEVIDTLYLGTRRFDIHLCYQEPFRDDVEAISNLLVQTADGSLMPLSQVAGVSKTFGPIQINREKNRRRSIAQGNVRGGGYLGGVVAEIRERIARRVDLPPRIFRGGWRPTLDLQGQGARGSSVAAKGKGKGQGNCPTKGGRSALPFPARATA
jgi:cobalt-zinc-cadmium resistance protein CzcA